MDQRSLRSTTKLVKAILEKDTTARNSDSFLYFRVINEIALRKGDNMRNISMFDFLLNMNDWGYPPFESVRRTRQKIQAQYPELAADNKVQGYRDANELEYREYARGAV